MNLQTIQFDVDAGEERLHCILHEPVAGALAKEPALLLAFGMSSIEVFSLHPQDILARVFAEAGHRVLSFDLPHHATRARDGVDGLEAMRDAFLAGDDPFARFARDATKVVDECEKRQLIGPAGIAVGGISRGGYCALEWAMVDQRVQAVAVLSPVTDWRLVLEFEPVKNDPRAASLNFLSRAHKLATRALYLVVGHGDQRVGTASCVSLAQAILRSREKASAPDAPKNPFEFHIASDSQAHALSDRWRTDAAQFLLHCIDPNAH